MKKSLGIDIGGTKIAAGIITEAGELLTFAEVKSDPTDREKMFLQVVKVIEQVIRESNISIMDIEGIGVGVPGKVDRENGIAVYQNNLPWGQFPLVARLRETFGIQQIIIDNDVYMAAFAEWKAAKGKSFETFTYVTISTGISCSIIHNGAYLRGAGFAGELGLMPVLSKAAGSENKRLEKIAAGPAIQELAKKTIRVSHISTKDVFTGYTDGDLDYQAIIDEVTDNLAQGVYSISCLLDPHKMVFGGSVIVNNPYLLDLIKDKLQVYQLSEQQHILEQMSVSTLAQNNGIVGAGLRVFETI